MQFILFYIVYKENYFPKLPDKNVLSLGVVFIKFFSWRILVHSFFSPPDLMVFWQGPWSLVHFMDFQSDLSQDFVQANP